MTAQHRRAPDTDGTFAGIALAAVNLLGLIAVVYTATDAEGDAPVPVAAAPDVPPTDTPDTPAWT